MGAKSSTMGSKHEVLRLYKTLLYMGKEYPAGYDFFKVRLNRAFLKNKSEQNPERIKQLIKLGEYIVKELEAMYSLKKYRAMKDRYYNEDNAKF